MVILVFVVIMFFSSHNCRFEKLQQEMQNGIKKPLYPQISRIEKGRYCLANFNGSNEFLRAIITAVHEDGSVDCFYADTGDTGRVCKDDLRYLSDDYIRQLPFQVSCVNVFIEFLLQVK